MKMNDVVGEEKLKVVQCPDNHSQYGFDPVLFLAGGISNCPDWQQDSVNMFSKEKLNKGLVLINPRRINFSDAVAEKQIEWEYTYLKMADAVLFWFPSDTLCPITLYELGCMASSGKKIFVGCDPKYQRTIDVTTQLRLRRPEIKVHDNLQDVVDNVIVEHLQGTLHNARNWHF